MSERFFSYLRQERSRLNSELEKAQDRATCPEVGRIEQLRAIVDDQLARWERDLSLEPSTA